MISRRNIRVKVMQELYALQSREDVEEKLNPVEDLQKSLQYSTALFVYLLWFITQVARYAEKDAKQRALKNLPSAATLRTWDSMSIIFSRLSISSSLSVAPFISKFASPTGFANQPLAGASPVIIRRVRPGGGARCKPRATIDRWRWDRLVELPQE